MLSLVMIGATGAVGNQVAAKLMGVRSVEKLTLLGRRPLAGGSADFLHQHSVDLFDSSSYRTFLPGHRVAICTLGVGQPSKVSREEFVKVDKVTVLEFASACKAAGVEHFQLLSSVDANAKSKSFYLRTKGELEDGLKELAFERLSLFHPSMILTPQNRYGLSQGLMLHVWPHLNFVLAGSLRKYRGIEVDALGRAIALNALKPGPAFEVLCWDEITALSKM